MAKANISLQELQQVLEKSGLPMDSAFNMRQGQLGAGQAIRGQVGDRGARAANKGIMAQLAKIAEMDQKLSSTYSDPTSQLYIENPVAREKAIYGRRGTEMSAVSDIVQQRDSALQEEEDIARQAESLYSDLTTAQAQVEAETKRVESQTKKLTTDKEKNSRVVKDEKGNTAFELTKQQAREARNAKVNLKDAKAVSEFFNRSKPEFRKYMEDLGLDGKIKGDNLTAKQIAEYRKKWEDEKKKKSVKDAQDKAALKKGSAGTKKSLF